jgi:hypothetical protein
MAAYMPLRQVIKSVIVKQKAIQLQIKSARKSGEIPSHFYMVFPLSRTSTEALKSLRDMKIKGVQGISDSAEIIPKFLDRAYRNAILRMDGLTTAQLNNMTRVQYDNPYYLMSNDMEAMQRVWLRKSSQIVEELLRKPLPMFMIEDSNDWVHHLGDIFREFQEIKDYVADRHQYTESLTAFVQEMYASLTSIAISHPKYEMMRKVLNNLTPVDLKPSVKKAVVAIAKEFSGEGEWIIKDSVLKIPKNSRLYVVLPKSYMPMYHQWVKFGRFPLDPFPEVPDVVKEGLEHEEVLELEMDWEMAAYHVSVIDEVLSLIQKEGLDSIYKVTYLDENKFRNNRRKRAIPK